jgi:hypothetical protein
MLGFQGGSFIAPHNEPCKILHMNRKIYLLISLSFVQAYYIIDYVNSGNPNEETRVFLTRAIVDDHTLTLDNQFVLRGTTIDRASFEGHYYSDKAPGTSFLAVPVELVLKAIEGGNVPIRHSRIAFRIFLLLIPTFFLCFYLWKFLDGMLPNSSFPVTLTMISYMIGSGAFPYTQYLLGHQLVAVFLTGSFLMIYGSGKVWRIATGGVLAGLAILTELQAAPTTFLLWIMLIVKYRKRLLRPFLFIPGVAAGVAGLMLYNYVCFKNPFSIAYDHLDIAVSRAMHDPGLAGVTYPKLNTFILCLFGFKNGLFIFTPLWLCAVPGFYVLWKSNLRTLSLTVGSIFASWVIFVSSANGWWGGWSVGPRLLTPMLAFLTLPTAAFISWSWNRLGGLIRPLFPGLAAWGIVVHAAAVAVQPAFHVDFMNPIFEHGFKVLSTGVSRPSLGTLLGLSPPSSLLLFALCVLAFIIVLSSCGFSLKGQFLRMASSIVVTIALTAGMGFGVYHCAGSTPESVVEELVQWEKSRFKEYFKKEPVPLTGNKK